jgi:hypothetical protein
MSVDLQQDGRITKPELFRLFKSIWDHPNSVQLPGSSNQYGQNNGYQSGQNQYGQYGQNPNVPYNPNQYGQNIPNQYGQPNPNPFSPPNPYNQNQGGYQYGQGQGGQNNNYNGYQK